jgi:uncharacterized protein (DUF885 family)
MRKILIYICIATGLLMISCNNPGLENSELASIDSLFDAFSEEQLRFYPILATKAGDYRYNDVLPNHISNEYIDSLKVFYLKYKKALQDFNSYSTVKLDENRVMSYEVLMWECNINLEAMNIDPGLILIYDGKSFSFSWMPIDQFWSTNLLMGQLAGGTGMQPFKTVKDYDNWLKRVNDFMNWCETAIQNMRKGMKTGHVLPKVLIQKIIPQMEAFAKGPAEEHLYFKPVLSLPDDFTTGDSIRIARSYKDLIEKRVIPGFRELHEFFGSEYLKAGRETSGFSSLPNGDKVYRFLIKYFTTTNLTADEVFTLGEQEVERIKKEMEKVKEKLGFKGDLKAFFEHVRTNKELMPFTEPQQVIDHFNAIHEKMKPNLAKLFDLVPKTGFEVKRTEAFREKTASAQYFPGSQDGSRPGIFYIPIPDVSNYNIHGDEVLFLHEAIPGHHYQISLQQENKLLPGFRQMLWQSAYGEGWALYTEVLGTELGLYTDLYQYFGMLSSDLHRAMRLVADVGLHAKGWTRDETIDYFLENGPKSRAAIEAAVDRYMALPAQALSYKIGQLKILELRKKAEKVLGEKFDIKKFHTILLEPGCIPLQLLEERVNRWIIKNSK